MTNSTTAKAQLDGQPNADQYKRVEGLLARAKAHFGMDEFAYLRFLIQAIESNAAHGRPLLLLGPTTTAAGELIERLHFREPSVMACMYFRLADSCLLIGGQERLTDELLTRARAHCLTAARTFAPMGG